MNPAKIFHGLLAAGIAASAALCQSFTAGACTSAVSSPSASAYGRGMLWKHRDTSQKDNVVIRTEATDSTMAFVALCNAGVNAAAESWIGFNEAGFAVMNTASYNLEPDTATVKDREGQLMTRALGCCRSVADFEALLKNIMANERPGVQANFGVIDASGSGAYFEMSDNYLEVFPIPSADSESAEKGAVAPILIRSNYSYSGGKTGRLGEARHDAAKSYLEPIAEQRGLIPEHFTEHLSRSFYHYPTNTDLNKPSVRYIEDRGEVIPRRSSTASVVIEGAKPGEDPAKTTVMWVAIGFPTASYVLPVTLDSIPAELQPNGAAGHSPLCDEVNRMRDRIFARKNRQGKYLFDMNLIRRITPGLKEKAAESYRRGRKLRGDL